MGHSKIREPTPVPIYLSPLNGDNKHSENLCLQTTVHLQNKGGQLLEKLQLPKQ